MVWRCLRIYLTAKTPKGGAKYAKVMYFLSVEERKQLFGGLLPRARSEPVSEELRGWSWHQPPLQPIYDLKLSLFEVANRYCRTGRDLYLRRVLGVETAPNLPMIQGAIFHKTVAKVITTAKRLIYQVGIDDFPEARRRLSEPDYLSIESFRDSLSEEQIEEIKEKVRVLWEFESTRICSRAEELLASQPRLNEDSLVFHSIPVVVEQKLDGAFLGLSSHLSVDAFTFATPVIFDLKFDVKRDFHRLSPTGYALVMEAMYEFPVDIGCTVYACFKGKRILLERDFYLIDNELRQNFVEERDEKMRMVYEELDPGRPEECYATCPYIQSCRGE